MKKMNKELRTKLMDGTAVKNYLKEAKPQYIDTIGLWGAEPTLNHDCAGVFFKDLFKAYYGLKEVMFSTNLLLGHEAIIDMIESSSKAAVNLKGGFLKQLRVQMSLDGPDWVTDVNRHKGATKQILKTYNKVLKYLEENKVENIQSINFSFKPTLPTESMKQMNDDHDLMLDYFKFFEEVYEIPKQYKLPKYVSPSGLAGVTVVNPGEHSVKDGKEFGLWLKNVYSLNCKEVFKYYRQPMFFQFHQSIEKALELGETSQKPQQLTCGGGYGGFSFDGEGNISPCHRAFTLSAYDIKLGRGDLNKKEQFIVDLKSKRKKESMKIRTYTYHNNLLMRMVSTKATIKQMAITGQIDKVYLTNQHLSDLLAIMASTAQCYVDTYMKIGSAHVSSFSFIRYFGNGALQEILKDLKKRLKRG